MGKRPRETASSQSSAPTSSAQPNNWSSTNMVKGSHEFIITGYSLSKGLGPGKYIASDSFNVGGHSWAIYYYPDGKSLGANSDYLSLFVALTSEASNDVQALFELTLLDQSGKERHKVHTHFGKPTERTPYTIRGKGYMWGYKRFFRRTILETSDYLKDDCLHVHCTVGVVGSQKESTKDCCSIATTISKL